MPRLFTGIELPESHQDELSQLECALPGARWVDADNLHVTLRFAGDVAPPQMREWCSFLDGIDVGPFDIRIAGLGSFGAKEPKVIWAGIEASPQLDELAHAHERAARAAGLEPVTRAFKAHVTLARLRHTRADLVAKFLERNARFNLPPFTVERFVLFSSRPNVGGGPYVVEAAFALAGTWGRIDDEEVDLAR